MKTSPWFRTLLLLAGLAAPTAAQGLCTGGPATSGPAAPSAAPGALAINAPIVGSAPSTDGTTPSSDFPLLADLTQWNYWWTYNQDPYLALKARIQGTGSETGGDGWFLGEGQKTQKATLRPTEDQIRTRIVPALLDVLAKETNNDLVQSAMLALAKIGDGGDPAETMRVEAAILVRLKDSLQLVRESAALALGVLASPRSIPTLAHLLWDTDSGHELVKSSEVPYRLRAFAAYGLGLIGARATSEVDRQVVVAILRRAIESDRTSTRDVEVACLLAIGLVPLETYAPAGTPPATGRHLPPPESSRQAQLDYVLAILRDDEREQTSRAQCPITLARLLAGVPEPVHAQYRALIADDLLERIERDRERPEVVQSAVLALGALGTNDGHDTLDAHIRRVLAGVPRDVSEPQARAFAFMALADAGGRAGADPSHDGLDSTRAFLMDQIVNGRNTLQPWASLAAGVLCHDVERLDPNNSVLDPLRRILRLGLEDERRHDRIGAYALGAGLAGCEESAPHLMHLLEKSLPDDVRGDVALGLGLLGHTEAIEPLRAVVEHAEYRPELLRKGAIALGLLGDKEIGPRLVRMLEDARSLATQSAITGALAFVGDRRSVDPLLRLLASRLATERSRAFAAAALGGVADKELLPWNSKIGFGVNYRAAPATLTDPLAGNGVLDRF
jgi:HEAT repeat protein